LMRRQRQPRRTRLEPQGMLVALELVAHDLARRARREGDGHDLLMRADQRVRVDAHERRVVADDEGRALRHVGEGVLPDVSAGLRVQKVEDRPAHEAPILRHDLSAYKQPLRDELHLYDAAAELAWLVPCRRTVVG